MKRPTIQPTVTLAVLALVACAPPSPPPVTPEPPTAPPDPDAVGILLGDSVVRGFGGSPVLYESHTKHFEGAKYRFHPQEDRPVQALRGFKGLDLWLNRGVTGNTSDATVARWTRDVAERYDRGSQKRRHRVRALLVSIGITDIGAAMGTDRLGEAEANLERNMLTLSRYARASHIPIAFLEIPDPTRAPLGAPFRTRAGTPVKSFCEAQEYSEEDRAVFMATIQRIRAFMEGPLRASGAEVIDYASFLPAEYFWDSHHPSKEGYLKLGALLTRPHLRKASRRPA